MKWQVVFDSSENVEWSHSGFHAAMSIARIIPPCHSQEFLFFSSRQQHAMANEDAPSSLRYFGACAHKSACFPRTCFFFFLKAQTCTPSLSCKNGGAIWVPQGSIFAELVGSQHLARMGNLWIPFSLVSTTPPHYLHWLGLMGTAAQQDRSHFQASKYKPCT